MSRHFRGRSSLFFRFTVWLLIFTFMIPAPVMSAAADGSSHVLRRLNSPERARAIEEATRLDAAAREEFARQEQQTPLAQSLPEQGQGSAAPLRGDSKEGQRPALAAGGIASADRPRSMTEIVFNGMTGLVGLPGLTSNRDFSDPNADQGLGFHQDGTARRADGTTGNNAASARYDGRRAASFAGHGATPLGVAGYNDMGSYYGPGYDPVTGYNWRIGDPSAGGRRSSSRNVNSGMFDDPQQFFLQRGLNYGVGWANSMGEAGFTGLTGKGRARLNFMVDIDGRINGEGDLLYPFYDGQYTTVFGQVGARSMSGMSGNDKDGRGGDRWIGNFGLGQRWYPAATLSDDGKTVDSGNWMVGYNVFFDQDFTRSHQRGGVGVEAQYDWFKVASNYYFPISNWKGSDDFDSRFVEERPAKG